MNIINIRACNNQAAGLYVLCILLNNNGASSTTKISFLEPAMIPVSIFEDRFSADRTAVFYSARYL